MNALTQSEPSAVAAPPQAALRTLVLSDLVDSTALVERLGDVAASELFRKHDRVVRTLLRAHGGREIDKTDGFLAMFERPVQAVAFALDCQRALKALGEQEHCRLSARIGIHVGDVLTWDNAPEDVAEGAKQVEVEGLVKPITSRLMQLALPDQILLSGVAYALAHRAQGELGERLAKARWRTHGRYRFKGIPDPIPVFEVGEEGHAPLRAPPWSGKAHREVPFWRRPAMVAVELAILLAVVVAPALYLFRPAPAIAFANRDWVVVGDLVNRTDETKFDDALQAAFRIGLEQSRHVNVLSDLKMRETVRLMQRDPDKTPVDRAVGSEVAIRDGARALVLPSVAEIGGRVRVTAEVIDPQTQTTVWSESADGVGEASVLPSLDKVNRQLRVRLGEALATVSSESKPLERVATKNLDALRAYAAGNRSYETGDMKEAIAYYDQAIRLDPEFARAHLALASSYANIGRNGDAVAAVDAALASRERLDPRDVLHAEAQRATLAGSQAAALEKWKMLARLYPDFFLANGSYAFFASEYANRRDAETLEFAARAASPKNPRAIVSEYLLGMLYLGREQYDESLRHFAATSSMTGAAYLTDHAAAFAAQRQFAKAEAELAKVRSSGVEYDEGLGQIARVVLLVDQGKWQAAREQLGAAGKGMAERAYRGIDFSLDLVGKAEAARVRAYGDTARQQLAQAKAEVDRTEARFALLFAAYLAAREGNAELSAGYLDAAGPEASSSQYPMLRKLATIARAERLRVEGKADAAIALLAPTVDDTEPCLAHVVLMEAYAAAKRPGDALREARWLTAHRGRAYAEYSPQQMLLAYNVLWSNLAGLNAAEYALAVGDKAAARSALDAFVRSWPEASRSAPLAARINAVRTES